MTALYQLSPDQEISLEDQLRLEPTWDDVARGLRKVVVGYLVLLAGIAVASALIVGSVLSMGGFGRPPARLSIGAMWQFYLGLGVLSVTSLVSWGMVLAGKFRCLLNAPERHLARWFIFLCVFCIFVGPIFNTAAGIALTEKPIQFKHGARGLQDIQLTKTGRIINSVGLVCEMLSPLAFLLFLRAIARCLELKVHLVIMNVFIAVAVGLTGATGYLLFAPPRDPRMLVLYLLCLGGGWLACGLAFLVMTLVMRNSIFYALDRVRSPLEAPRR
jgi:hypothetical protein